MSVGAGGSARAVPLRQSLGGQCLPGVQACVQDGVTKGPEPAEPSQRVLAVGG